MSKLYFTFSAMNAGKSAILLQAAHNYGERGMAVMLWTSGHHAASPEDEMGEIESRIGLRAPAHIYRAGTNMFAMIAEQKTAGALDAIFIDEAQFLTREQVWQLARVGDELGLPVLCYGLRTDFQGKLFEGAAELLAIADDLREARTICHCGRKATMNLRRDASGDAVTEGAQVGVAKSDYVSLCRKHWLESLEKPADAAAPAA
ncbi:thymidine kinase [Hyphobacterium sp. HN65]|uniref:Thymidine kinase n=1 Tax=Hyphobacterium lacteum TaxID=3116575 RepID=A0ABU7LSA1_9PROT|nr:thymidine kinase [Hyphobacterium sp. HN65]MEE2526795.1 thymidine kinase [Hyphobacterium sp. HN65]